LTHLQRLQQLDYAVHLLRDQHRMHPDVSRVISHYQYEGVLRDAPSVTTRQTRLPASLCNVPRAVWYVLDEDGDDLPAIRAERDPGGRSWVRKATSAVLAKLFGETELYMLRGLFITPFRAQAREVSRYLAKEHLDRWTAGTVHARQGTEAQVVIFDTVNAGSCAWPYDEWKRLVNVGLSRAQEFVVLLASRAEMNEPYLRPLVDHLAPRVLKRSGRAWVWAEVPIHPSVLVNPRVAANPDSLGSQLERRKALRPIMSRDQQRLCGLNVDGKPRLVRGVAGSGKTLVLAHWVQKTVQKLSETPDARVWAVYANRDLERLIKDTIEEAWRSEGGCGRSPLERVQLFHVKDVLLDLYRKASLRWSGDPFDYNAQAAEYLKHQCFEQVKPCCPAMFIDEAQDMGPDTLRLLSALVEPMDLGNPKARAVNIFYDDHQNINRRPRPKWTDIGLDMIGRATVMKESFRSTRPITEFALNVLYRLQPPDGDADHKELVKLGLIEQTTRNGQPWWNVRFNSVEGPSPVFRKYPTLAKQVTALADQVMRWITEDGVRPCDISVTCLDNAFRKQVEEELGPRLKPIKARIVSQPGKPEARETNTVIVSCSASFKGYEAELVVIGGLERFIGKKEILPNNLYVAMTRARSLLAIFAYEPPRPSPAAATIISTVEECLDALLERPEVEEESSNLDDFEDVLEQLGATKETRAWLERVWGSVLVQQEPILAPDGEILAQPLFWFQIDDRRFACFGDTQLGAHARHKLEDHGVEIFKPGAALPSLAKP
jgi:hypothetical protein